MNSPGENDFIWRIQTIQELCRLDEASIAVIRLLQPWDTVEIWCSEGFIPHPGVVHSNDGNTLTIASETFQHFPNTINGMVSFNVETACSDFFEIDNDTLLYYHFKIPYPYKPDLKYCTKISNILTKALFDSQKSDNTINYPLRWLRNNHQSPSDKHSDVIEWIFLDDQCDRIPITRYMRQLKKWDVVNIGFTDGLWCRFRWRDNKFSRAHPWVVLSNNWEKVRVYSSVYENRNAWIGCRSFEVKTGYSSGPAYYNSALGLCFYHIEVPHSFIPEHQRKYVDLPPEDITILPVRLKISSWIRPLFDNQPIDEIPF